MSIPSIVIAGTNSGCGKTTISMGIMAALAERGLKVQPFKVGPDYIDPMFHTFITGRESRNLDSWMLEEDHVRYLFARNSSDADIAVIEGVMGLYDGCSGSSSQGSTAHVSKIINAPVVLVINGEAMSLSAAALVKGFAEFDKGVIVKGVIINNISGKAHYEMLKEAIEGYTGIAVLGYLQHNDGFAIGSRHLGLVTSDEIHDLKERTGRLARQLQETVDLDMLLKLSKEASNTNTCEINNINGIASGFPINSVISDNAPKKVRLAVARDKAFCFYYRDNLDLLEMLGAELVFFSPVSDSRLPENMDGMYFGGGYPEIWAEELQNNITMRLDIKRQIESGMPAYAECGGLMYMTDSITGKDDRKFEMVGLIPGESRMTSSLNRFGYVFVKLKENTILAEKGSEIRAHEFHFSETEVDSKVKACYEVSRRKAGLAEQSWDCGFKAYNLLAGYAHMHFWSNPEFAKGFVRSCLEYKLKK